MNNLINKDTWQKYVDGHTHISGFAEYIAATTDITAKLQDMIKKSPTAEALKENLDEFCKERKSFVRFAEKHFP